MSCNISSENDKMWRMVIGGMMELYSDGFTMLKCISMWIALIDVNFKGRTNMPVNESTALADYQ